MKMMQKRMTFNGKVGRTFNPKVVNEEDTQFVGGNILHQNILKNKDTPSEGDKNDATRRGDGLKMAIINEKVTVKGQESKAVEGTEDWQGHHLR